MTISFFTFLCLHRACGQPPAVAQTTVNVCDIPAPSYFLPQEKWAWEQRLCVGNSADMSQYPGASGKLAQDCATANAEHWPATRELSENFLGWVIPRIAQIKDNNRVTLSLGLSCALFPETFGFNAIQLESEIYITNSYFENGISFQDAKISYSLVIQQSRVAGTADFTGAIFGSDLNLYGSTFGELLLTNTTLRGLYAKDAIVETDLSLNSLIAAGHVLLSDGIFHSVDMRGAVIAGTIELENSKFYMIDATDMKAGGNFDDANTEIAEKLNLNGAVVSGCVLLDGNKGHHLDLDLRGLVAEQQIRLDGGKFHDIDGYGLHAKNGIIAFDSRMNSIVLNSAQIDGAANFSGVKIAKNFSANDTSISTSLILDNSKDGRSEFGSVDISASKILGELDIDQTKVGSVNASGVTIDGALEASDSQFGDFEMANATIQGVADFSGDKFSVMLDLNGTSISGSLNVRAYNSHAASSPTIDLTTASIGKTFDMSDSSFGDIIASGSQIGVDIVADGATLSNMLNLHEANLVGSFLASPDGRNQTKINNMDISNAHVLGGLDIEQADLSNVNANSATIWEGVRVADSKIGTFSFENAALKSFVNFSGSSVQNELDLNGTYVQGLLKVSSDEHRAATISFLDLTAATIGGTLDVSDSKFGTISANDSKINLDVLADGANLSGEMKLNGAAIGGGVLARGDATGPANIAQIDLTVASIGQRLDVSDSKVTNIYAESTQIGSDVRADGATVSGTFDLAGASLGGLVAHPDNTSNATISKLSLDSASISDGVDISGASFKDLDAAGVRIEQSFFVAGDATISDQLNLNGASIMGLVWLAGQNASFGAISGEYSHFGAAVSLQDGTFRSIDLLDSTIAGSLYADHAKITNNLKLDSAHISGSLVLGIGEPECGCSTFNASDVSAHNANIGGDFEFDDQWLATDISAQGIIINGDLRILFSEPDQSTDNPFRKLDFSGGRIGRDLALQIPGYNGVADFSRVTVGNQLDISSQASRWSHQARLDLSSATTRLFITRLSSWGTPGKWLDADIEGFSYDQIQVPEDFSSATTFNLHSCNGFMAFAPIGCVVDWLHVNDNSYSRLTGGSGFDPGIYDQLAKTFNKMGRNDDAKEVLYQEGLRQRQTTSGAAKFFLILDSFTGYGQKPIRLTYLALVMLTLGYIASYWSDDLCDSVEKSVFARRCTGYPRRMMRKIFKNGEDIPKYYVSILSAIAFKLRRVFSFLLCKSFKRLIYSLDNGLPLGVTLVERHKTYEHENSWLVQAIFIVQKALGYIIVLLAVTALAQTLYAR